MPKSQIESRLYKKKQIAAAAAQPMKQQNISVVGIEIGFMPHEMKCFWKKTT